MMEMTSSSILETGEKKSGQMPSRDHVAPHRLQVWPPEAGLIPNVPESLKMVKSPCKFAALFVCALPGKTWHLIRIVCQ
jgi:hypothetical protein